MVSRNSSEEKRVQNFGGDYEYFRNSANKRALCVLAPLKGKSPVRGNVCEADKRVPVHGVKAGKTVGFD